MLCCNFHSPKEEKFVIFERKRNLKIEIKSFMGRFGFLLRCRCPRISSWLYLRIQVFLRKSSTKKFISKVMEKPEEMVPLFVNIETINRCNGTCPFCPANVKDETREFKKMPWELFEKIIICLKEINYEGVLALHINNEPFLDNRMEEMLVYARKKLQNATILIFTNGTLLTPERLEKIDGNFDRMYINNYSEKFKMNKNIETLYKYVKNYKNSKQSDSLITVQLRYANEYLTNRAGTAPNKKQGKKYKWQCIIPYTDMTIFPDGTVGICCNDTKEVTNYGNIGTGDSILTIFRNEKLMTLRKALMNGRNKNKYCQYCDVIDSGIRLRFVKKHTV